MIPVWTIVVVLGRPSLNTRDFFNSIRLEKYDVEALNRDTALEQDPAGHPNYLTWVSEDYVVLNWYGFPKEE